MVTEQSSGAMDSLSPALTQDRGVGLNAPYRGSRPNMGQWNPLVELLSIDHWRKFARLLYDGVSPQLRGVVQKATSNNGYAQHSYGKQIGLMQRELRRSYDVLEYLFKKRTEREAILQEYYREVAAVTNVEPVELFIQSEICLRDCERSSKQKAPTNLCAPGSA